MKIFYLLITCFILTSLATSCNRHQAVNQLADFQFHISSKDNMGLIQLPDTIGNEEVIDIKVTNKPKGSYEIFMGDFQNSFDMNHVVYEAPSDTTTDDEIQFELKTASGNYQYVTGRLSNLKDGQCEGSDPSEHYNFAIQNFRLKLKPGDEFRIQLDGLNDTSDASGSLLPNCDIIQNYGFRSSILIGLGKKKLFPQSHCCSYSYGTFNPLVEKDRLGFTHDRVDGPLLITGTLPADAPLGRHRLVYGVLVHKLDDGSFLSNFRLYPQSSWEWSELLTIHKYGVITIDIESN
ncbi:hypothetical protein [Roseivirga sp. E12]|uniref:hypothetical protein n=1 Tax=Roseivirga sp. E12 TaxID=2819237 RepID=UPI001ABC49E5|nr:hypothetical protein [Roseivirga sp. E12]MBO3700157.1 hypothetical protein [Roseivirga sp. E12]